MSGPTTEQSHRGVAEVTAVSRLTGLKKELEESNTQGSLYGCYGDA